MAELDLFGDEIKIIPADILKRKFIMPPFSVLSARDGDWQERKRMWLALGIKSEEGRLLEPTMVQHGAPAYFPKMNNNGGSVFDPVLCELAYSWFCPAGGQILDPFAGGSVRGIIAGLMGYKYHGIELRAEQVEVNRAQRLQIAPETPVEWVIGDSREELPNAPQADFIFSCPPYGDLEEYSDNPKDLSTLDYPRFLAAYYEVIYRCAQKLKDDRMACFVVGDFRDKKTGMYRGFVADTIQGFREHGLTLYNDAILVTSVGSLPIRVSGQFEGNRKLGKTHQNILVFAKGDPTKQFNLF